MCREKSTLLVLAAALAVLACLPAAASAQTAPPTTPPPGGVTPLDGSRGPCGIGAGSPTCDYWFGKVTFIGDGDTMSVDLAGDRTKKPVRVRVTGIDAMEQTYYTNVPEDRTGECHANEATARLEYLVKKAKGRVRLAAQDPESRSRGRLRRAVSVKIRGKYRDVARMLLNDGHALPLPTGDEWAWNVSYGILAERAAASRRRIWDPLYCGPGPDQPVAANLKLWANWDAPGSDSRNPNGEWVKIRNLDPLNGIALDGWWVRDSGLRRFTFPYGTYVPPGQTLTLRVGEGVQSGLDLYWGLRRGVFDNVVYDGRGKGDAAYLFDPEGDLRAHMLYPCRRNCTDPLQGAVDVRAKYKGTEHVTIENVSGAPVDLEGYRLESRPYGYTFGGDSVLQPGEEMRVAVRGDPAEDTTHNKHWGNRKRIFGNGGDRVRLKTLTEIVIDCDAWGRVSC